MDWSVVTPGVFALLGVGVASLFSSWQERRRWLRDLTLTRIHEFRAYSTSTMLAIDQLTVVYRIWADVAAGGLKVARERVQRADESWRQVLASRYANAPGDLQHALSAADQARGAWVDAITAHVNAVSAEAAHIDTASAEATAAEAAFMTARLEVLDQLQHLANASNRELSRFMVPWRHRVIDRLRRRSSWPVAELPSMMAASDGTAGEPR